MQRHNQHDLRYEFLKRSKKLLPKAPQNYLNEFILQKNLNINLSSFNLKDCPFIEIMFTLPFERLHISGQKLLSSQSTKENQSQDTIAMNKVLTNQKLKFVLNLISKILIQSDKKNPRVLKFQNISIGTDQIKILSLGLQKSKYLRSLDLVNCSFKDHHFQILANSLSQNISLNSLKLSNNHLKQIGKTLCKILQEHGRRKKNIINFKQRSNKAPELDFSNTGIFQIYLDSNCLSDNSIDNLIQFLEEDTWVKSISLRNNSISKQKVEKFLLLLNKKSNIINLDLRQNQGLNKNYEKLIFQKLRANILKLKKTNSHQTCTKSLRKKRSLQNILQACPVKSLQLKIIHTDSKRVSKKENGLIRDQLRQFSKQSKKLDIFQNTSNQKNQTEIAIKGFEQVQTTNAIEFQHKQVYNLTEENNDKQSSLILSKSKLSYQRQKNVSKNKTNKSGKLQWNDSRFKQAQKKIQDQSDHNFQCNKCSELHTRLLKAEGLSREIQKEKFKVEKENFELKLQLQKLKSFIEKNLDVSAICTSANKMAAQNISQLNPQNSNISTSINKILAFENEDEMISKIQMLVMELTKIMETAEMLQNTQHNIEQPFSYVNSFSKTISLYEKPKDLLEIQQEILQEQALHLQQFRDDPQYSIQNSLDPNRGPLQAVRKESPK